MGFFLIIAFIAVFVLSIFFDYVKVISITTMVLAKLIISFFITGFEFPLLLYALLSAAVFLNLLGTECFNSNTAGTWIPRGDGGGWMQDINHPVQAFIGMIFGVAFLVGIVCVISYFSDFYYLLSIISGIELILSVISLFRVIRDS